MLLFWLAAGLLAALAGVALLARAARAPLGGARLAVDRRLLQELDDLRARGLIAEEEAAAARAEAGRRLLTDAAAGEEAEIAPAAHRPVVALAAGAVALGALGLYLATGAPGANDQPYAERVAAWRADLPSLTPEQLAAVADSVARERSADPEAWAFLGRARNQSGEPLLAAQAFRRSLALDPGQPAVWSWLGESLVRLAEGEVGPDARAAFAEALQRDPEQPAARYHLGLAEIQAGRRDAGLAAWRALRADLPAQDPRLPALEEEIASVAAGGRPGEAAEARTQAMVRGMVERLAARLEAEPDDPAGWARLVRAYGVLGESAARDQALAEARRRFAGRPDDLAAIEAAAR